MKAKNITNIFMLKEETLQGAGACITSNKEEFIMMWHLKLGHMFKQCLRFNLS